MAMLNNIEIVLNSSALKAGNTPPLFNPVKRLSGFPVTRSWQNRGLDDIDANLKYIHMRESISYTPIAQVILTHTPVILIPARRISSHAMAMTALAQANASHSNINGPHDVVNGPHANSNGALSLSNGPHANSNGALSLSNAPHANSNGALSLSNAPHANSNGALSLSNAPHTNSNGAPGHSNGPFENSNGAPTLGSGPHAKPNGAHECDCKVVNKPYVRVSNKNANKLNPKIYQFDKENNNGIIWIRYLILFREIVNRFERS
jgi:hypothetical protein